MLPILIINNFDKERRANNKEMVSQSFIIIIPAYYDWNNVEYLRQYPINIILLTCIIYVILNVLVGPVIEELK